MCVCVCVCVSVCLCVWSECVIECKISRKVWSGGFQGHEIRCCSFDCLYLPHCVVFEAGFFLFFCDGVMSLLINTGEGQAVRSVERAATV